MLELSSDFAAGSCLGCRDEETLYQQPEASSEKGPARYKEFLRKPLHNVTELLTF